MFFCKTLALALCWVSLVRSQSGSELQSLTQRSPGVTVSVSSVRNQTGHWLSQVTLGHDNSRKSQSAPWSVEVEPSTSSCSGVKSTYDVRFTLITPPSGAGPGYELFPDLGYYKFHTDAATWPRAREVCEEEGGHLVILNSEEESKAMVKLFAQNLNIPGADCKDCAWVGLRESEATNGLYFTIFGRPLESTGFSRWTQNEPTDTTLGDYIWMHRVSGGLGDWIISNSKLPFICEQSLC